MIAETKRAARPSSPSRTGKARRVTCIRISAASSPLNDAATCCRAPSRSASRGGSLHSAGHTRRQRAGRRNRALTAQPFGCAPDPSPDIAISPAETHTHRHDRASGSGEMESAQSSAGDSRCQRHNDLIWARSLPVPTDHVDIQIGGHRMSSGGPAGIEGDWARTFGRRDQLTCAQVLRLTAAQADTSLMPNSAASCR